MFYKGTVFTQCCATMGSALFRSAAGEKIASGGAAPALGIFINAGVLYGCLGFHFRDGEGEKAAWLFLGKAI